MSWAWASNRVDQGCDTRCPKTQAQPGRSHSLPPPTRPSPLPAPSPLQVQGAVAPCARRCGRAASSTGAARTCGARGARCAAAAACPGAIREARERRHGPATGARQRGWRWQWRGCLRHARAQQQPAAAAACSGCGRSRPHGECGRLHRSNGLRNDGLSRAQGAHQAAAAHGQQQRWRGRRQRRRRQQCGRRRSGEQRRWREWGGAGGKAPSAVTRAAADACRTVGSRVPSPCSGVQLPPSVAAPAVFKVSSSTCVQPMHASHVRSAGLGCNSSALTVVRYSRRSSTPPSPRRGDHHTTPRAMPPLPGTTMSRP